MAFTKISNAELNSRGATTLPNQPAIPPAQLKQEFDAPAKEVVAPKFNNLIDELEAETGAASIGISPPEGRTGANIQALVDDISSDLATVEGTVGDATSFSKIKVDADTVEADILDDTVEIEAGAGMVIDVDTANKKITLKAPGGSGGGDMSQAVYDTDHNGIVDKAETLNDGTTALTKSIETLNNDTTFNEWTLSGRKNLMPYPWIDFTVKLPNSAGHIYDEFYRANAETDYPYIWWSVANTPHAEMEFQLCEFELPAGDYILTGCPETGGLDSIYIYADKVVPPGIIHPIGNDTGEGLSFSLEESTLVRAWIKVSENCPVSQGLIYPMIRLAKDTDDTYEPYVRNNKELSDIHYSQLNGVTKSAGEIVDIPVGNSVSQAFVMCDNGSSIPVAFKSISLTGGGSTFRQVRVELAEDVTNAKFCAITMDKSGRY